LDGIVISLSRYIDRFLYWGTTYNATRLTYDRWENNNSLSLRIFVLLPSLDISRCGGACPLGRNTLTYRQVCKQNTSLFLGIVIISHFNISRLRVARKFCTNIHDLLKCVVYVIYSIAHTRQRSNNVALRYHILSIFFILICIDIYIHFCNENIVMKDNNIAVKCVYIICYIYNNRETLCEFNRMIFQYWENRSFV